MKNLRTLTSVLVATALCAVSCTSFHPSSQQITTAVSVGTSAGLRYVVKDPAKRTVIANYIDVGAAALRTVTGTPTPDQLNTLINQAIPADIRNQYPELIAFVSPLVISSYQLAFDKYGPNAEKLYQALNDIALGLEAGAAPYISHS
jgi:hypothetical protein